MSDKNHEQKNKFIRRKIIIKNLLENRNLRPFCYGNAVVISADACPLQGRTAPNAKRFGIVSYTYRLPIEILIPTEVMNYVVFSMPHGEI